MNDFRSRNFVAALFLLFLCGNPACDGGRPAPLARFMSLPAPSAWRPVMVGPTPVCACASPGAGRVEVHLTWGGKYLAGRARLHLGAAISGSHLLFDSRLAIQKTSWPRGADCADPATQEGCTELPPLAAGATLEFEFGFRHAPWSETTRMRAFAFPSLFTIACPAPCRSPLGAWPTRFSMRRPTAPTLASAAGMTHDGGAGDELSWEQASPMLGLVIFTPPMAVLAASGIEITGYGEQEAAKVLSMLHPFTGSAARPAAGGIPPGAGGRLQVVFDDLAPPPWGIAGWRFVTGGSEDQARLSDISALLPAWVRAPSHAREGAVLACRLAELDPKERVPRLKKLKQAYLQWLQQRATADPVRRARLPIPTAYWTLLFAGTLQRSAGGPSSGDCAPLHQTPGRPALLFHEVLAGLVGRAPPEGDLFTAPSISVRVESITPKKDTVTVKIYNKSAISLWLPIRYTTDKNTWNHWVYLPSTGMVETLEMQHTGKPVNILIDPEDVTLALPFGWTDEGAPEDLEEP